MILSEVSLKSLTNCQESFTLRGNTQELALGAGSTQRSKYPPLYPHFYGRFKSKITFVQLSLYQEPKCIGLNQALEYSPLSPPTILFRHSQITTMSSYQKVNIGRYRYMYPMLRPIGVGDFSKSKLWSEWHYDAIIVLRFEKGRISQSNVGTLLVLPGTTVSLSDKKHSFRDSLTLLWPP